ncbi:AmmeMemoRadiSam system protein B [bacterium]|nr:AmmeMemoRadiSam system protein B [bacterium]NIN91809.1 AmmeMemoRadiSam system protein B [bacterium]NIO18095.1 AmmeMemoRadiSam system protein B [bacterium]NIO73060.1 AmmeMemoRadiSam system protein B [bacterium]
MYFKKTFLFFVFLFFCISSLGVAEAYESKVRRARWSGPFYDDSPKALRNTVEGFFKNVNQEKLSGKLIALVSPHAGYIYSGQVAAYAYRQLKGENFDTVILLGPSHHVPVRGASVYAQGWWKTPLAKVKVDSELAEEIISKHALFYSDEKAHKDEHSLEVQLPFLQATLKDFKIVPIVVNDSSQEFCQLLADAIVGSKGNKKILIVASTDMSHYHTYGRACLMDGVAISDLENFNLDGLRRDLGSRKTELCGGAAVFTSVLAAKALGADRIKLLKYANSGDVTGDKRRVVGYGAFAIMQLKEGEMTPELEEEKGGKKMLDEKQQKILLGIARKTVEEYIRSRKIPEFNVEDPLLKEKRGVFVTLRKKGMLRGCIGYIMPLEELHKAVSQMAIQSSTGDPRFPPLRPEELAEVEIEISVLTVPERIKSVDEIEMGKHGVIVKRGANQGVFLPQVATETGWSKEEFLNHLCYDKARLSADAWKDKETEIYTFSAQVFEEEK